MDCQSVRALLPYYRRAAEGMDAADRDAIRQHLDACPECGPLTDAENQIDQALGGAMRTVAVPPALKGRILDVLAKQPRPILSRRAAAIAAGLLLALGITGYGYVRSLPLALHSAEVAEFVDMKGLTRPEDVEEWFLARGVTMSAPREFNYRYLKNYDLVELKGRLTPQLLFSDERFNNPTEVQVYVLPAEQFRMDPEDFDDGRRVSRILVRRVDELVYVILVQSGNYHHLLHQLQ